MSTSNTTPAGSGEPFDVEEFARQTIQFLELGDDYASVLERRVIRIEECIAARWPRRWLLWARLRREVRASVATWDPEYIPRDNFYARRLEAAGQEADEIGARHRRARRERQAEEDAETVQRGADDSAGAGEGFLP